MDSSVYLAHGWRRFTSNLRSLPGLLIIGAMRSGTSSLAMWLYEHDQVRAPRRKEIHYFDLHYHRGTSWYRSFFPIGVDHLTIDATPSYMTHRHAAERAADVLPQSRLIALLRDPAERAWSHYRLKRAKGRERRDFRAAIESEFQNDVDALSTFKRLSEIPYLRGGMYAAQLRPWVDQFGREALLVVESHRLSSDPSGVLERVQTFLELEPEVRPLERFNAAPPESPDPGLMAEIRGFLREDNSQLSELVGLHPSWLSRQ